jgi:hypothetical protein
LDFEEDYKNAKPFVWNKITEAQDHLDAANFSSSTIFPAKGKKIGPCPIAGENPSDVFFTGLEEGFARTENGKTLTTARHMRYRRIVPHQCAIPYLEEGLCAEASLINRRRTRFTTV